MAVSSIDPLSNATAFIQAPLTQLDRLTATEAFARVLETSVSGPPMRTDALAGVAQPQHFVNVLEQALLRDLVNGLQRVELSGFTPGLEPALTSGLGLPLSAESIAPLVSTLPSSERLAFTTGVAALFSTIQLLGIEPAEEPQIGGLLDTLA
jgi:hypothetical protein